jgi:hypothetical protein
MDAGLAAVDPAQRSEADGPVAGNRDRRQLERDLGVGELEELPFVQRAGLLRDRAAQLGVGLGRDLVRRGHQVGAVGEPVDRYPVGRLHSCRLDPGELEHDVVGRVLLLDEAAPLEEGDRVGVPLASIDVEALLAEPSGALGELAQQRRSDSTSTMALGHGTST